MKPLDLTVTLDRRDSEVLAVYMRLRKGSVFETVELEEGVALADYDKKGHLLGVELLAPCRVEMFDKLPDRASASALKMAVPIGFVAQAA